MGYNSQGVRSRKRSNRTIRKGCEDKKMSKYRIRRKGREE
jgi:hypothetical protein